MKYKTVIGIVVLTPERHIHIITRHPIMEFYIKHIGEVLSRPEKVRFSNYTDNILLFYRYFANIENGKYIVVVVNKSEHSVKTTYLSDRVKGGRIYEQES